MNENFVLIFFVFNFNFQSEDTLMELLQNLVDIDITFQELKVIDYIIFCFEVVIFNVSVNCFLLMLCF